MRTHVNCRRTEGPTHKPQRTLSAAAVLIHSPKATRDSKHSTLALQQLLKDSQGASVQAAPHGENRRGSSPAASAGGKEACEASELQSPHTSKVAMPGFSVSLVISPR